MAENNGPPGSEKQVPAFLRRVFLSKRELRLLLQLLRTHSEGEEIPPWKQKLIDKIDNHLQKAKSRKRKERRDDGC